MALQLLAGSFRQPALCHPKAARAACTRRSQTPICEAAESFEDQVELQGGTPNTSIAESVKEPAYTPLPQEGVAMKTVATVNSDGTVLVTSHETAKPDEVGFFAGFGAAAGLFTSPVAALSLYNVASTGAGLHPGPYGLVGVLEGISFLVAVVIVGAALFCKITTGSGLPAGPLGLLGLSEGLSFLSVFGVLVVFPLTEFGVVGNPETAIVNVPAVAAAVGAVVGPLVALLIETVSTAVAPLLASFIEMISNAVSNAVPGLQLPEGIPSLPDANSMPALPSIDLSAVTSALSAVQLPDVKLPDVKLSNIKLSDVKLPEGVPTLPEGLPSLPEGLPSLPEGLPSLPEGLPSLPTEFLFPEVKLPDIKQPDVKVPDDFLPGGEVAPSIPKHLGE